MLFAKTTNSLEQSVEVVGYPNGSFEVVTVYQDGQTTSILFDSLILAMSTYKELSDTIAAYDKR